MNDAVLDPENDRTSTQRIDFARNTLGSVQQLIALMDQKSYLVLVITGVTSAGFFSIVGGYLGKLQVLLSPSLIVPVMSAWFLCEAGLVLWYAVKSIQGVVAKPNAIEVPNMVFPNSLLRRYEGDAQRYFDQLRVLTVDDILKDYSAEIVKTSHIYVEKFEQVDTAIKALYRSMIPWLIGILSTIIFRVV